MRELILAFVAVLSWTAATFFTNGVETMVDNYFLEKYHNKAIIYFAFSFVFLLMIVFFTREKSV